MKLKPTIIIALLITQFTFAQDLAALKAGAQKIYTATTTLDYDSILDSTYPKLFEIVSKEQMKEMLVQTFNGNEQMKIKLLNLEPEFNFGEIKKIDNQTFCMINHNLGMELTLTEKVEGEEVQMMIDLIKEATESDKVTFNPETNTFTISKKATMIGVSDALTKNQWTFINRDKKNALVTKLFSEKVIKELGM